jgi:hypothetical protein
MKNRRAMWLMVGAVALLLAAMASQFLFQLGRSPSASTMPADVIPAVLPGVAIKDLLVAETESVSKAVAEGLGFSDYRYREYRKNGVLLTVYLAYWQDRKRHYMDLGTHAPDNCWVSNGWVMDPKLPKKPFALESPALGASMPGKSSQEDAHRQTWPAESRVFHAGGNTFYVAYWHLLDGQPIDYSRYGTGKTMGYFLDNLGYYWRGTGEQYFLRIASNRPLQELERDSVFKTVLASLAQHLPLEAR